MGYWTDRAARCDDPGMDESRKAKAGPNYWIGAGLVVVVLGLALQHGSDENQAGTIGLVAGGAMFLFGIIAKVIQLGIESSRRGR
jgi:hypothetical protein